MIRSLVSTGPMIRVPMICRAVFEWSPSVWIFTGFFAYTMILYWGTLADVPRSDHIEVFTYMQGFSFPENTAEIAFMEFFGHPRFQPLAWLFEFFEIKVFGSHFFLYHLLVVVLHALNALILYKIMNALTHKKVLSFFAAFLFVSLFTHFPLIVWPLVVYSPLSVTLSLLALLSLLNFVQNGRSVYLYLAYGLALVSLFFYELNMMVPGAIFVISVALGWSKFNKRSLIKKSLALAGGSYIIYATLYLILMPRYAGLPGEDVWGMTNILSAVAAVPIEFVNTVFSHNIFASSEVIFDELVFAVPFTPRSFSMTTIDPFLIKMNFVVYGALLVLVLAVRRPMKGRSILLWVLVGWAVSYTALMFSGRDVAYGISQMRHAYLPSIMLIIVGAHFYERYFRRGWALIDSRGSSFFQRYGGVMVVACLIFFIGLNTAKTASALDDFVGYCEHTNAIYYEAKDWLGKPHDDEDRLFIAVTTYPPHEKLAWGADILPDLFLNNARITKDLREATAILEWNDGEDSPSIRNLSPAEKNGAMDDFSIMFGIMPHQPIKEDVLEILGNPPGFNSRAEGKQWWLRLYFENPQILESDEAGRARLVLGYYYEGNSSSVMESQVFTSEPVSIKKSSMNHFVLVREDSTFGLILDGTLVEKTPDITEESYRDVELPLGKLYRMGYRKPYYMAHTFVEFGRTAYSIRDKQVGDQFESIRFKPQGFQEYHINMHLY